MTVGGLAQLYAVAAQLYAGVGSYMPEMRSNMTEVFGYMHEERAYMLEEQGFRNNNAINQELVHFSVALFVSCYSHVPKLVPCALPLRVSFSTFR